MSSSHSRSQSGSHSGSRTTSWVDGQSHISYRVRGSDSSARSGNSSRSSRHQSRAPTTIEPPPPIRERTEQGRNSDENSDSRTVRDNSMAMVLLRPPPSSPVSNDNPGEVDGSTVRDHSGDMVLFNQQAPRSHHGSQSHHVPGSHHGSRSHHGQLSNPLPSRPPSPPPTPSYQGSRASVVLRAPAPHSGTGHNSLLVSSHVHTRHASSSSLRPGEVCTTMQVEVIFSDGHGRSSSHHTSRRRSTITSKTPRRDM